MPPNETRQSLIVRLKSPESDLAWRDFVCTYERFLQQLAIRQGVPQRHVADVTQNILLVVAQSIQQWEDDGNPASFRRWISTVARNAAIRFMSREGKHASGVGGSDLVELLQQIPDKPDQASIARYEHELIVWAAEQVKQEFLPSSWRAFWATLVEGRSVDEVAQDMGISSGSIYMSRSRIMARIRRIIQEIEEAS